MVRTHFTRQSTLLGDQAAKLFLFELRSCYRIRLLLFFDKLRKIADDIGYAAVFAPE